MGYELVNSPLQKNVISPEALSCWNVYFDIFKRRWGLDATTAEHAAITACDVFEAEFQERGPSAYETSINLPLRNAMYQAMMIEWRWTFLREMGIASPVLDYGCGVGLLSLWLHRKGYKNLYVHDLPGIQNEVMREAIADTDIQVWDGESGGFNTIICINVLEHVENPMELLNRFYSLGNRVIADICIDEDDKIQGPHIAPKDELRKCREILIERNGLYRWEGPKETTRGTPRTTSHS